jgi:acetylornithine/succinyldiaminopimelate/putrescine aminotransferase
MSAVAGRETSLENVQDVVELESRYLLQNYARHPLVLVRGDGPYMWDAGGKRYLDFIAGIGVNALGQNHPRIVRVIQEQSARLIHTSNLFYNEYQGPLAKRIAEVSGLQRTFFTNSGTESTEGALKMMKAHGHDISPEKYEIISLENSFHGRTLGALSITGQPKYRKDFEPLMPGVKFVPPNDIAALDAAVSERTAGIFIEWIQGEGGVFPIDAAYCRRARELADRYDALLCFDEIQCGVGRGLFRLSAGGSARDARHHDGGQTGCMRNSPGLHHGERKGGKIDSPRHARLDVWRQRAGRPRVSGIFRYSG